MKKVFAHLLVLSIGILISSCGSSTDNRLSDLLSLYVQNTAAPSNEIIDKIAKSAEELTGYSLPVEIDSTIMKQTSPITLIYRERNHINLNFDIECDITTAAEIIPMFNYSDYGKACIARQDASTLFLMVELVAFDGGEVQLFSMPIGRLQAQLRNGMATICAGSKLITDCSDIKISPENAHSWNKMTKFRLNVINQ